MTSPAQTFRAIIGARRKAGQAIESGSCPGFFTPGRSGTVQLPKLDTSFHLPDNACMPEAIIIEGIRFQARCGVTLDERQRPQPLLADLEVTCSAEDAIHSDSLAKTVDYAQVIQRMIDVGTTNENALIERLADQIAQMLILEFPIHQLTIWLRKAAPPLPDVSGSVGVRLTYPRTRAVDSPSFFHPSPFLHATADMIPKGKVLDVAAGEGRHALYMASQGYEVIGLDRDGHALDTLTRTAKDHRLSKLSTWNVDLEKHPEAPPSLGNQEYEGILVFFYLFRPLFPSILQALKPGGVLIYETFLIDNHVRFQHPRRKEFCLGHNELLHLTHPLRVLHYQEGPRPSPHQGTAITARLVAQKA